MVGWFSSAGHLSSPRLESQIHGEDDRGRVAVKRRVSEDIDHKEGDRRGRRRTFDNSH